MPTINDQTSYVLSVNLTRDGEDAGGGRLTLLAGTGVTDEIALAAYQALLAVPWDPAIQTSISLLKVDDTQTTYQPDLNQTPAVFT